ncbi:MAG: amidohydrolase [Nocardioidaceae bacterium]
MVSAELVFTGGAVFRPSDQPAKQTRPATTVAVCGGRITAVGDESIRDLADPRTEVVDMQGKLLVPGFQDAHVHPVQGGLERLSCDLSGLDSAADYLAAVGEYAGSHRSVPWITGGGWMLAAFPQGLPHRNTLDAVVNDRPVSLVNRDHHGAWVNSRALELAGVTADTPDPVDGRIERSGNGQPTGVLHEGAMDLVNSHIPPASPADYVAALLEAQRYLHSLGITAWQDAILGSYANIVDASAAYLSCVESRQLTARVVGALWWDRSRGVEQIHELVERRAGLLQRGFRATSVKIMQDGIAENFTAAMTQPYLDGHGHPTNNTGLSMVDPDTLSAAVVALDRLGFQVHVHAIGDRAVRDSLDAFQAALFANGPGNNRHHIAHIQVIDPADVGRFAELDVSANMQALWAIHEPQMDDLTIPFLGPQRSGWQYPFASLQRSGARLVAGSDWPVTSPNPLWAAHVAVNRRLPPAAGGVGEPFMPEQALDVTAALSAYTSGSAFVNHLDDTGRIEVGASADLAVLDRDIVAGPTAEIGEATVLATYVEGRAVYRADR